MPEPELAKLKCTACRGDAEPLKGDKITEFQRGIDEGWKVEDEHHLVRTFKFKDFVTALEFVNCLGRIAEEEGHHPDIYLAWGKVRVKLYTHKIDGLHENDFIMAAKADTCYQP